jgi:outer membrane protein assembly factor BamB
MVSRRVTLQSVGTLLVGLGAGCIGQSGPASDRVEWQRQVSGTPLLNDGTIYILDRLTLYALSPTDGSDQWTVAYEEDNFDERLCLRSELAVDDRRIYVSACDGLRALRRSDGEQVWSVDSPLRSGVTVNGGRVYANGDDLLAIDADGGDIEWRVPTDGERLTRLAATEDVVVFTNRADGVVTAFDTDGEQRWTYRTETETRSPTIVDGVVYVATAPVPGREGRLLALDIEDGAILWNVETPSLKRGTRPVVDTDAIYLGCNGRDSGRLVSRSRQDGSERWSFTADNRSVYEPVVDDGTVYAGSNDNTLYAFSLTGETKWTVDTDSTVGSVAVGDEFVYASNNERLVAVERS